MMVTARRLRALVAACIILLPATAVARVGDEELSGLVSKAIESGDIGALGRLLDEEGIGVDQRFRWGGVMTPMLSRAVGLGEFGIAAYLVQRGADVTLPAVRVQPQGDEQTAEVEAFTPLMAAAGADHAAAVTLLLAEGAEVDATASGNITALMVAAAYGNVAAARALLTAGPDLELQAKDLQAIAPFAVQKDAAVTRFLGGKVLSKPVSVQQLPRGEGATALWVAAAAGSAGVVEILLAAGADRETEASCAGLKQALAGEEKCAPARVAALLGRESVVRLLGGGGSPAAVSMNPADPRAAGPADLLKKVAHLAHQKDAAALAAYLDAGLDVNARLGEEGEVTPLVLACRESAAPLVRLLLERGADPNAVERGADPDKVASGRVATRKEVPVANPLVAAVTAGCEECVSLLLDADADVEAGLWDGLTPLMAAVTTGNAAILDRLIAADSPLEAAVRSADGSRRRTRYCLPPGATALWIAACRGDAEAVRRLLAAGADAEAEAVCEGEPRSREGETECTVRRIAEIRNQTKVVALLGGEETAGGRTLEKEGTAAQVLNRDTRPAERHRGIRSIVRKGDLAGLRELLDAGIDRNELVYCDNGFVPLLSLAILAGKHELFELLIERGASVETMSMNEVGRLASQTGFIGDGNATFPAGGVPASAVPIFSPLMYAVFKGNDRAFERLLALKADVNSRGLVGVTALMAAGAQNRPGMVKRLLGAGARIEEEIENPGRHGYLEADGATALWLAAFTGAAEAARALLDAGADPWAEAECRADASSRSDERECDARRIAELRGKAAVVTAFDAKANRKGKAP